MTEEMELLDSNKVKADSSSLLENDKELNEINLNLVKNSKAFVSKKNRKSKRVNEEEREDIDYVLNKSTPVK